MSSSNLFFFNRVEEVEGEDGKKVRKAFRDSINLSKVLRTIQIADNLIVVMLDDGREEKQDVPILEKGKMTMQSQRRFIQTQIPIEGLEQVQAFLERFDV